jgi:hypothetical protein
VTFDLEACRLHFAARDSIHFPAGLAGNVLRGALGSILRTITSADDYARIFEPTSVGAGPSGLSDWPRPFVIRPSTLDGQTVRPGEQFDFALHLFDLRDAMLEHFTRAFGQWAELRSVDRRVVTIDLSPRTIPVARIRVEFQTPTDLKSAGDLPTADFSVLLARARDRVSTLRSLYGAGPLEIDFRGMAERARSVRTVRCELMRVAVERRSSRTGQRHGIGGFTGVAEYEGDLAEFLPYLEAAHWTGVGRHCAWGNGQIATEILNSDF